MGAHCAEQNRVIPIDGDMKSGGQDNLKNTENYQ